VARALASGAQLRQRLEILGRQGGHVAIDLHAIPVHSLDGDLLALQVTLQSYIDASLVNGALLSVDAESGKTVQYFPTKAHPKVMALGNDYVMCAEVVDAEGKASMADFYITRNGGNFVVFQSVVGHDPLLEKLMADNRVSMAN
jgi:hypothetical protein